MAPFLLVAAGETVHTNKVVFGELRTQLRLMHFNKIFPNFSETLSGSFLELEERSKTDFTIDANRPFGFKMTDRFAGKIPARILKAENEQCDRPLDALFLKHPDSGKRKGAGREFLYSFSYLACAGTGEISPGRALLKYMEKYGNYDRKDYDRNQHIYHNVNGRYEVRVKPVRTQKGEAGLVITVADKTVLKSAYDAWRRRIRELENAARQKF